MLKETSLTTKPANQIRGGYRGGKGRGRNNSGKGSNNGGKANTKLICKCVATMVILLLCAITGLTKNMCLHMPIIKEEMMKTIRAIHQIKDVGHMWLNLKLLEMLLGTWIEAPPTISQMT